MLPRTACLHMAGRGAGRAEMFPHTGKGGVQHAGVAQERGLMLCDLFIVVLSSLGWFLCLGGVSLTLPP